MTNTSTSQSPVTCSRRSTRMTGERARAIGELDTLLAKPYFVSRAWLRLDPEWAPLRDDPAFQRLLATPGP